MFFGLRCLWQIYLDFLLIIRAGCTLLYDKEGERDSNLVLIYKQLVALIIAVPPIVPISSTLEIFISRLYQNCVFGYRDYPGRMIP